MKEGERNTGIGRVVNPIKREIGVSFAVWGALLKPMAEHAKKSGLDKVAALKTREALIKVFPRNPVLVRIMMGMMFQE